MLRKILFRKRGTILALLVFGVLQGAAWAQTESVLYGFCARTVNCTEEHPFSAIILPYIRTTCFTQ